MSDEKKKLAEKLAKVDWYSDTWRAIQAHAQAQLKELRLKNDSTAHDAVQTSYLRGRIAAWKELEALPEKVAPQEGTGDGGYHSL